MRENNVRVNAQVDVVALTHMKMLDVPSNPQDLDTLSINTEQFYR